MSVAIPNGRVGFGHQMTGTISAHHTPRHNLGCDTQIGQHVHAPISTGVNSQFYSTRAYTGHVDDNTLSPNKDQDNVTHAKWKVKDAQVMIWILGSVDLNIVLNFLPYQTVATM
ncbi:hypothetical protein CR513_48162, partial [Mucuna pruriens]